jgi:hypothetical protein
MMLEVLTLSLISGQFEIGLSCLLRPSTIGAEDYEGQAFYRGADYLRCAKHFADLKQSLVDYGDISGDLTAAQRVEAAEGVVKDIREFEMLGYVIKVGTARDYRVNGEEWPCSVMAFRKPTGMLVTPDEVWLPKKARFGF